MMENMENNGEKDTKQPISPDKMQMAWLLAGSGALGSLYLLLKKERNIFSWIIPVGMMAVGIDILLKNREERIKRTGDQIIAELDELDPIARAEVVKYIVDQKIERG
jgi:hypothetical protein